MKGRQNLLVLAAYFLLLCLCFIIIGQSLSRFKTWEARDRKLKAQGFVVNYQISPSIEGWPRWGQNLAKHLNRNLFKICGLSMNGGAITAETMDEVAQCEDVRTLRLWRTGLFVGWATKLIALTNLSDIDVVAMPLADGDVAAITKLPKLDALSLPNCELGRESLLGLDGNRSLSALNVSGNAISNNELDAISRITNLQSLNLRHSEIGHDAMDAICKMRNLAELDLSFTDISASELQKIEKMSNLNSICLSGYNIDGTIVEALSRLPKLEVLDISDCKVDGSALIDFDAMRNLRHLHLERTSISSAELLHLKQRLPKCIIYN